MSKLNVIGLGYIGLPTALIFAAHGEDVVGTDYKKEIVESLNRGVLTFEEEGLYDLFKKATHNKIKFDTEYIKTDRYIITVPTPYNEKDKKIDPSFVISAVKTVTEICEEVAIIVIESTISPGTIDTFIKPIVDKKNKSNNKKIHIVHAPERIIPGKMVYELKRNARTIGVNNRSIGEKVKSWYSIFCDGEIIITDIKTAELSKVVENTFRDINIAFANELAKICSREGIDVYELINISNKHPRVNILQPGPGVGGHCISVDPWFLVGDYPDIVNVILAARNVNDNMPGYVLHRLSEIMRQKDIYSFSKVGIYGLSYKEDIDDMRESPSIQLLNILNKYFIKDIKIFDPCIKTELFDNHYTDFDLFLEDIDLIVIMVGHTHIKNNKEMINNKIIFDTRNIIDYSKNVFKL